MNPEAPEGGPRELRFEGWSLALALGVLVAALGGAFQCGRWYESSSSRASAESTGTGATPDDARKPPVDVDAAAGHFDRVAGREQQLEPQREVRRPPAATPPPRPAATTPPPSAGSRPAEPPAPAPGEYFVQVFAGRDESAARGLVERLESSGRPVVLRAEPEGGGFLYKVRVGGYADEPAARAALQELAAEGFSGAWVTRVEGR